MYKIISKSGLKFPFLVRSSKAKFGKGSFLFAT